MITPPALNRRRHGFFGKHPSLRKQSPLVWRITGTYNDQLAHDKFAVFALVSSLLGADAAKLFRQARKDESAKKRNKRRAERIRLRDERRIKQEKYRIDKLNKALLQSHHLEESDHLPFPPPHWTGEPRPKGYRTASLRSRFPSPDYVRTLVTEYGYDAHAAISTLARAHEPWSRPSPDRRHRKACEGADGQSEHDDRYQQYEHVSPNHPYRPASPSRRTHVGSGFTKEQVETGLGKMHTDAKTKQALFEIVYRRRSPLEISDEYGLRVEILHVYASRLRRRVRANREVDVNDEEKVA
jgi:hypothetical protein